MSEAVLRQDDRQAVDVAVLLVRLIVGVVFTIYGAGKLFGAFGMGGMTQLVEGLGPLLAYLVAIGEFFGGLGLIVGFLTRFSAGSLIVIMLGAIVMYHGQNGFFLINPATYQIQSGFEYNLVLIGLLIPPFVIGPGRYSIGRFLPLPKSKTTGRPVIVLE